MRDGQEFANNTLNYQLDTIDLNIWKFTLTQLQIVRKYDDTDELKLRALTNLINFMFIIGKATTLYKYYNNKLYFSFEERATKEKKVTSKIY